MPTFNPFLSENSLGSVIMQGYHALRDINQIFFTCFAAMWLDKMTSVKVMAFFRQILRPRKYLVIKMPESYVI